MFYLHKITQDLSLQISNLIQSLGAYAAVDWGAEPPAPAGKIQLSNEG